jgi:hypothetical protein
MNQPNPSLLEEPLIWRLQKVHLYSTLRKGGNSDDKTTVDLIILLIYDLAYSQHG